MTITDLNVYIPAELLNALVGPEGQLKVTDEFLTQILQEAENYVAEVYSNVPASQKKRLTALEAMYQLFLRQGQYDYVMRVVELREAELNTARSYNTQSTQVVSNEQIFTDEEREKW